MRKPSVSFLIPAIMLIGALERGFSTGTIQADANRTTVWASTYTAVQAARGETEYANMCSNCHGEALTSDYVPHLKGDKFMERWRDKAGALVFRLQNIEGPEAHKGHKIQIEGVLRRQNNADGVNVLSLGMIAETCAP